MRSARVIVGAGLILLSGFFLIGGFFIPLPELVGNVGLVPMPERLLGFWGVGVGVALAAWPRRRGTGEDHDRQGTA
ncbi:MAG: hypothetical protein ACRDUA_01355 [Micromonosporaceae bacterium]